MSKNDYYPISSIIIFIMFILLLSFNQIVEAEPPLPIKINEIMYFPVENDHYNEWIELFNPTSFPIDVNNWTLYDGQEEDIIIGNSDHGDGSTVIAPGGYAIITDHGTKVYENFTVSESAVKHYLDSDKPLPDYTTWRENLKRWASKAGLYPDYLSPKTTRKTWESWLVWFYPEKIATIFGSQGHNELTALRHYVNLPFNNRDKEEMKAFVEGWE